MLRALQLGISISDLDLLTIGLIIDMYIEALNRERDEDDDTRPATQADIDNL